MGRVNRLRYIEFRLVDLSSNPITGRVLSQLQVFFTRNAVVCTDPLSLVELGSGRYILEYTPSAAGHDYLEMYDPPSQIRIEDSEDIDDANTFFDLSATVGVSQDYGSIGRYKVIVSNPSSYVLYVFYTSDWDAGKTATNFALAATNIDSSGNWLSTPITLVHGTYNLVLFGADGTIIVVAASLVV